MIMGDIQPTIIHRIPGGVEVIWRFPNQRGIYMTSNNAATINYMHIVYWRNRRTHISVWSIAPDMEWNKPMNPIAFADLLRCVRDSDRVHRAFRGPR